MTKSNNVIDYSKYQIEICPPARAIITSYEGDYLFYDTSQEDIKVG